MEEIWKDIKDFEGLYQISNFGNVRSVDRCVYKSGWIKTNIAGTNLKQITDKDGYKRVKLSNKNYRKMPFVHRLVAQAFIPNPNNLPQVNHINEIKSDNCVYNLEWCNAKYNVNYGTRNTRLRSKAVCKKIAQIDLDGNTFKVWRSACEAAKTLKIVRSHILEVAKGRRKTAYGCKWKYV